MFHVCFEFIDFCYVDVDRSKAAIVHLSVNRTYPVVITKAHGKRTSQSLAIGFRSIEIIFVNSIIDRETALSKDNASKALELRASRLFSSV